MPSIIIIYDSETGNTEKTANLVAEGIRENKEIECIVKKVDDFSIEELLKADGVVIGSPTYYGGMSAKIKELIDKSVKYHTKLEGKVGAAFATSGGTATGVETTILSILQALIVHGMIVQGNPHDKHYGLAVVGSPDGKEKELCKDFGIRVANLVMLLAKAKSE